MKLDHRHVAGLMLALTGLTLQPAPASGGDRRTLDCDPLLHAARPSVAAAPRSSQPEQDGQPVSRAASSSIALFGGVMTDNDWRDFFSPNDIDFGDSTLAGIAASRSLWRFDNGASLEIEGQAVRHFGEQDHWELNLPVVGRWHGFPWDNWLDTSIALGIGPSWASKIPKVEAAQEGSSQQWMVYWLGEIEVGFPSSPWRGMVRLHHRSGAYGVVADEGGSNVLTVGIRRYW